jgi:hypothetical protein
MSAMGSRAQESPEIELGRRLAHCTAVFSMIRAAPPSLGLAMPKTEAETLLQLSMYQTYVLLGPDPGKQEINAQLATQQARLRELKISPAFAALLDSESKPCSKEALDNFPRLQSRIDELIKTKRP